jgi:hypothetical protein
MVHRRTYVIVGALLGGMLSAPFCNADAAETQVQPANISSVPFRVPTATRLGTFLGSQI